MADPRIDRTRRRLRRAAVELASRAPLGELSVAELTARAGINRATFYAHYRSIAEVVCDELAADLDPVRDEVFRLRQERTMPPVDILAQSLHKVVAHVRRFEPIYRQALDDTDSAVVWTSMTAHFDASIRRLFDDQSSLPADIEPRIAAAFGAHAITGALAEWLRHDDIGVEAVTTTVQRTLPSWWLDWK